MNKTTYRSITAAFGLSLALAITGCSSADDPASGGTAQAPATTTTADAPTTATDDAATPGAGDAADDDVTATALQAIATAEQQTGGVAYEIDDQDDDGTWEVDVRVGDGSVEVTVSADGTSVVKTENDDLESDDRAGLDAATITLTHAIETAVGEVGGVLDDAELDEDNGTHYWEVTVDGTPDGDDVDVKVNVTNGQIIEIDR